MVLTRAQKRAIETQHLVASKKRKQSHLNTHNEPAKTQKKDPPPRNLPPGNSPLNNEVDEGDPIAYWVREQVWPYKYIKQDPDYKKIIMHRILSRKESLIARRKRSEPGSISSVTENQTNVSYRSQAFVQLLQQFGSFMHTSELKVSDESRQLCKNLLDHEQELPRESLFDDDVFQATCERVADTNKAIVVRDILPLIVPSAEILAARRPDLECLIEGLNEAWSHCQPILSRPQPDYSLGFRRDAFTKEQLIKMAPAIGNFIAGDQSLFLATSEMYFPFLTCEVKCDIEALEIADRQNALSMTVAVRAIVELFRLVNRESEVHLQVLAFSVSHDHEAVRIYGHYPVIDKTTAKVEYYRYPIRKFNFDELHGRERWTSYRFTRNVYDIWVPMHLKRICSAIDQIDLPELNDPGALAETGLSQEFERYHLSLLNAVAASSDEITTADTPISSTNCDEPYTR